MLRYLRIAVTALSLTACVLLVALWVRSYKAYDGIIGHVSKNRLINAHSFEGYLGVGTSVWPSLPPPFTDYEPGHVNSLSASDEGKTWFLVDDTGSRWRLYVATGPNQESGIVAPHWFVATLTAGIAVAPWITWSKRFSLRTLLIATTLAAIMLGIIAFKLNRPKEQPPIDVGDFGTPFEAMR
jgi:hypothetical protein